MMKAKNILITGAAGFLGGHLINELSKIDVQITGMDICEPKSTVSWLSNNKIKWIKADVVSDDISKYFLGIDIVYHLAGRYLAGNSEDIYDQLCKLNVEGTKKVLMASLSAQVKRVIHISSAAVCGRTDNNLITEKDVNPQGNYGLSKLRSEEVVKELCKDKISYIIFRPTAFFGENHLGSLYELAKAIKNRRFIMIGDGHNQMNFLYVKDLVDILIKAAENPLVANQDYLIADTPIELKEFVNLTKHELGIQPTNFYIPRTIGLGIGLIFDLIAKFIHRPMPLSLNRVHNMTSHSRYSGEKLKERLNITFSYGVCQGWIYTIKWYKSQGLL